MDLIEDELSEVKKLCERRIEGSKLVACEPSMIRVEIRRTDFKRLIVCTQFPQDYPKSGLIIELKSKTLSERLLQELTNICEQECRRHLGKPQILPALTFLRSFIDENPLSCCYDEISNLKRLLNDEKDELKLEQKSSSIQLKAVKKKYYLDAFRIVVPDDYPQTAIRLMCAGSNFPTTLFSYICRQCDELARQCVEPPIRPKKDDPPFRPSPSLEKACAFMIEAVKDMPGAKCQFCKKQALPEDPPSQMNTNFWGQVECMYCGHLYHLNCLDQFARMPPLGNKRCPTCNQPIKLAEDRWWLELALEQGWERELDGLEDLLI